MVPRLLRLALVLNGYGRWKTQVFLEITHFYNSFIMHYTEYFTLWDCSGFLQIRSHM